MSVFKIPPNKANGVTQVPTDHSQQKNRTLRHAGAAHVSAEALRAGSQIVSAATPPSNPRGGLGISPTDSLESFFAMLTGNITQGSTDVDSLIGGVHNIAAWMVQAAADGSYDDPNVKAALLALYDPSNPQSSTGTGTALLQMLALSSKWEDIEDGSWLDKLGLKANVAAKIPFVAWARQQAPAIKTWLEQKAGGSGPNFLEFQKNYLKPTCQSFGLSASGSGGALMSMMMALFRSEKGQGSGDLFSQNTLFSLIDQSFNAMFPSMRISIANDMVDQSNQWSSILNDITPPNPTGDASGNPSYYTLDDWDTTHWEGAAAILNSLYSVLLPSGPSTMNNAPNLSFSWGGKTINIPPLAAMFPADASGSQDTASALSQVNAMASALGNAQVLNPDWIKNNSATPKTISLSQFFSTIPGGRSLADLADSLKKTFLLADGDSIKNPDGSSTTLYKPDPLATALRSAFTQAVSSAGQLSSTMTRSMNTLQSQMTAALSSRTSAIMSIMTMQGQLINSAASMTR